MDGWVLTRVKATQICGLITVLRNYQSKGTRLNEMLAESMPNDREVIQTVYLLTYLLTELRPS
jgi:curved DNA-binding protein CbpA